MCPGSFAKSRAWHQGSTWHMPCFCSHGQLFWGPGPWRGFLASLPASGPPFELKSDRGQQRSCGQLLGTQQVCTKLTPSLSAVCLPCSACLSWTRSEGIGRGFQSSPQGHRLRPGTRPAATVLEANWQPSRGGTFVWKGRALLHSQRPPCQEEPRAAPRGVCTTSLHPG